jgi:hypothetical protein
MSSDFRSEDQPEDQGGKRRRRLFSAKALRGNGEVAPAPAADDVTPAPVATDSPTSDNTASSEPTSGNGTTEAREEINRVVTNLVHGKGHAAPQPPYKPTMADLKAAFGSHPQISDTPEGPITYDVREPKKNGEYFQAHPDRRLWLENEMLVDADDFEKGVYPVSVEMQGPLGEWLKHCLLVPCITPKGTIFIWPIPIADLTLKQRPSKMEKRRREIAAEATTQWITLIWTKGQHVSHPADDGGVHHGTPKWPQDLTVELILERAFLNKLIGSRDHDIAKIYLGTGDR